jgi:hypothetical protein
VIAHVVLFKPKSDLRQDEIRSFGKVFKETCMEIPGIRRVRVGRIFSFHGNPSEMFGDKTYEVAAYLEFEDMTGLRAYLQHPKHAELSEVFWRYCESAAYADAEMVDPITDDMERLFG